MSYIQPVSFLHKILGNEDNMKEDMSIVKQDGFYVSFLMALSLEIFVSVQYYFSIQLPYLRSLDVDNHGEATSHVLNVKYQLLFRNLQSQSFSDS